MAQSLKTIAANCLSLSPPFSVVRDIFGYSFGKPKRILSLKRQLELMQGPLNCPKSWTGTVVQSGIDGEISLLNASID